MLCVAGFDGYFKRLNHGWEEVLGYSTEDLLSKPYLEFVHPEDHEVTLLQAQQLVTLKETITFENRYRCQDGSYKWLHWNAFQVPGQSFFYAAVRDITERRNFEERLRLLESAVVNANDAITISEVVGGGDEDLKTLQIVYINKGFTQLTGFGLEEVVGKPPLFLQSDYISAANLRGMGNTARQEQQCDRLERDRIRAALQAWEPLKAELLTYRKDGSQFWGELNLVPLEDSSGRFTHWLEVQRDITERKLAEMKLNAYAQAAAIVAELGQQALAGIDLATLIETAVNRVAQALEVEFCQVLELMVGGNAFCLRAGFGWQKHLIGYPVVSAHDRSQAGYTLLTGKPVIVEDLRVETRFSGEPWLHNHQIIAGLSVIIHRVQRSPVSSQSSESTSQPDDDLNALPSQPFGVLSVHTNTERQFSEEEVHFLQNVANVLATAIERKRAEEALKDSEERYALAVKGSDEGLWDWNLKTNEIYFSPRWKAMLGYQDHEISDRSDEWFNRVHPEDLDRVNTTLEAHLDGLISHFEKEYRILHANGSYRWVLCRGLAVRDSEGKACRMSGSQTDITDRKVAEEQLIYDAFHDALTGLPNRALFMDRLSQAIRRSANTRPEDYNHYRFAVLFLDLDRFKVVNDSLGHLVGDHLLVAISRRLERELRSGDTVARLGGDEFAILLEEIADMQEVTAIADRIQKELKRPLYLNEQEVFISASMGIAVDRGNVAGHAYRWPGDLLRDADIAMYRAKALGKARYEVFDTAMHTCAVFRLQLENDLRRALEKKEFRVHYQPIINLASGKIIGLEALVRLFHPERGLVSPADFIPVAEETGLIIPLGAWVLREACQQTRFWQQTFPELMISVNLSARQFVQPDLLQQIQQILYHTGLAAQSLKLEITESVVMEDAEAATVMLQNLKDLGVQISIDDFGTGYSSLSYLHHFPINTLKIDRSFVNRMGINDDTSEIVQAIISLAHSLHMDVVAEGIETPQQLSQLRALHCEQGQGYLFSKPLDNEATGRLLATERQW